jgi:hypothetical protein
MSSSSTLSVPYSSDSVPTITQIQSASEASISLGPPRKKPSLWRKFIQKKTPRRRLAPATITTIGASKTTSTEILAIRLDIHLSPEDREERLKTLQLAADLENLYENDGSFRHEILKGIEDIQSGRVVTFSEDGWSEE